MSTIVLNAQSEGLSEVRNDNCFSRNKFIKSENHSSNFQNNGKSPYFLIDHEGESTITSPEGFITYLDLGSDYHFELASVFEYKDVETFRYKEYYKDKEILPGGFTFRPDNPCKTSITAFIYSDIDEVGQPDILKEDLDAIIDGIIIKADLVLDFDQDDKCYFKQYWRIQFYDENQCNWGWIDASNGQLIREIPCADSSDKEFNLDTRANHNLVSKRSSIDDFDPNEANDFVILDVKDCENGAIIDATTPETLLNSSNISVVCPVENQDGELQYEDANRQELFQAFLETNACFDELGLEFPTAYIIAGCPVPFASAIAFTDIGEDIAFQFPWENELDLNDLDKRYTMDIISHEYGHHFLNNFFTSATSIGHNIIHEYFADLFAIHVVSNGCGQENDFQLNFDDGSLVRDFKDIDLENPCKYLDFENPLVGFPHSHAEPFRYMAYIMIEDRGFLNLAEFFDITVDILSAFPDDGSLNDLAEFYIDAFKSEFGECSEESEFLTDLFEDLCLFIDERPQDCTVNFDVLTGGPSSFNTNSIVICENRSNGYTRINIAQDDFNPDVKYFWSGLRPEWTINGITNNTSLVDNRLTITFPPYSYYPRNFTICAESPQLDHSGCLDIALLDCDGDDPTCEELFEDEGNFTDLDTTTRSINELKFDNNFVKIYDISGKLIYSGLANEALNNLNRFPPQVFIIKEYKKSSNSVEIVKYFNQNSN